MEMNMNAIEQSDSKNGARPTLTNRCLTSCRKLMAQLEQTKSEVIADFRSMLGGQEQMLRLALNEAEALAWQTEYPHLVFPALAMEKAQGLAAWHTRQRSICRSLSLRALAA